MDFRESFWNPDYPTESDAGRIFMFSRKGLSWSVELLLYLNKFSEPSLTGHNFKWSHYYMKTIENGGKNTFTNFFNYS